MSRPAMIGVAAGADELLGALSPIAFALAAESPALVVDLSERTAPYPSSRTLADIAADGPTRAELSPGGSGTAILGRGDLSFDKALEVAQLLATGWPTIVARVGVGAFPFPVIPVRLLLPGFLAPEGNAAAVWQRCPGGSVAPGPGPVLPPPSRSTVSALLEGRRPLRSRWIRAWKTVWGLPWH